MQLASVSKLLTCSARAPSDPADVSLSTNILMR